MKCAECNAVLSGEPTCPSCGTLFTVSRAGVSIPAMVEELEHRLSQALEGRYELRGLLGHGGMGAVFLAAELSLDRLVAIKVLPPSLSMDEELLTRFQREAKTAARLDHRSIVPIYAVEDVDGLHFYVMKFVPGTDLSDEIPESGMDADRARELIWESAVALGHAHRRGVIHRDVKPANIMIDPSGRALLTDFGIAKAVRSGTAMTSTGQMIGTPQYMSPEQMEGKDVDGRADQYSLGMVAWHALAGREPFGHGSVAALLVKQLNEYPESMAVLRPEVPDAFVGAIERAIRKDPDERFESMEDFARAMWPEQAAAVQGGGRPPVPGSSGSAPDPGTPKKWIGVAAAVVLLAAVGVVGASMLGGGANGADDGGVTVGVESRASVGGGGQRDEAGAEVTSEVESDDASTAPPTTASGGNAGEPEQVATPTPEAPRTTQQAAPATPPAEPEMGSVTIFATPRGTLFIDRVEIGETPIAEHALPVGTYEIEIQALGCETYRETVEVLPGTITTRRAILQGCGEPGVPGH